MAVAAEGSQLAALCAISSFLWLSSSVSHHPLVERPILSSALVLLIAGILSFGASYASLWLPGANGRFDEELVPTPQAQTSLPRRPRRYFLPALGIAIALRLEVFVPVNRDLQCARPGVEYFLPLLLIFYELLPGRRPRPKAAEKTDTLDQSAFEDFDDWLQVSKPVSLLSGLVLSYGGYLAATGNVKSTYFCGMTDNKALVFWAQVGGLVLDAVIVVLLWRILAWARTTKSRLRTLSGILLGSAGTIGLLLVIWRMFFEVPEMHRYSYKGVGSLFVFDVFADGFVFSIFCISAAFVISESTPSTLAGCIVLLSGISSATHQTALVGTWENVRKFQSVRALMVLIAGFISFTYSNGLRSVLFMRRVFVFALLATFLIVTIIYIGAKGTTVNRHPVAAIIHDNRVESDRWLVHASESKSLKIAVAEYQERNHGRNPPPKFDIWYEFATKRKSPIIDAFDQIGHDILPFWGLSQAKIREGLEFAAKQPGIAIVKVQDGVPSHGLWIDHPYREVMDDLVGVMKSFSEHLPNMEFAVNYDERPRVLAPWDDVQRLNQAGLSQGMRKKKLLDLSKKHKSEFTSSNNPSVQIVDKGYSKIRTENEVREITSPHAYRQMTALSCSPGSKGRSGVHWNTRDFCSTYAAPQSSGLFLRTWGTSLDICHQPDLARLHGFHIVPPKLRPFQSVLPIFSRSKTASYADMLLPLKHRLDIVADAKDEKFDMKTDSLHWRGKIVGGDLSHELIHGGHQQRLVHMVNTPASTDKQTLLLPHARQKDKFRYETSPAKKLKTVLPLDVQFQKYEDCSTTHESLCEFLKHREFGHDPNVSPPLKNRYVLLTDSDDGPSVGILPTLESTSVPFISSVFREWYTERLYPWVHFVPVDIRYHGLLGTLSYFTGLKQRGEINGRDPDMDANIADAVWIAEEGRKWAGKALRNEDREVYLFRLLLEWARIIDEKRDEIGFVIE